MAQQTFEELVAAVKQAESRGKRYADDGKTLTTSAKGALGEMQVMPGTIKDPGFGVIPAKSSSPDEIARVGRDYLQAMKQKYGDTDKALIAYNWGPGATDKWIASGAKPEALPQETKTYVQRVKSLLGKDVSRETQQAKTEPTPAEEIMTKALPAGTTAIVSRETMVKGMPDIKSLPASYQAAFALAALADAKDDEKEFDEDKETESEKLMREYKPVNHLASLDLSVTPITMADGGEVDEEDVKRPDDINYFSNVNRMKDRGTTTDSVMLGARKKAGEGSVMAGLNMANMSRDEKMQTARALMLAYMQQDPEGLGFTANVVKPQGAPAMANLIGSMPLGEGRVSAGVHGNQAYSLGYERPVEGGQFNANLNVPRGTMGLQKMPPQLNLQFNKRFADGGDVSPVNRGFEEEEDVSKPFIGNPNISRQAGQARRNAAIQKASYRDEVAEAKDTARKGEAYQELEKYLQSRNAVPDIKVTGYLPEGTHGLFSSDITNVGTGTIKVNKNVPEMFMPSTIAHEMTHAADRQMMQQAKEQKMFGNSNQFTEAYEKMVGSEGRNRTQLLRKRYPEFEEDNRYYRADPKELVAHAIGAYSSGPVMQDRAPRHVDATAATEFQILMDLAQRNVDKGPTGLAKIPAFFKRIGSYADGGEVDMEGQEIKFATQQQPKYESMPVPPPPPATRSAKELDAYIKALNPGAKLSYFPEGGGTLGHVSSDAQDILNIQKGLSPRRDEETKLHELEHSLTFRAGDPLGRPKIKKVDNNYQAYYMLGDWRPMSEFTKSMADNREKLEQFFGRPLDNAYFKPETLASVQKQHGDTSALFDEQLASLSALEQITGKSLTRDPEMKKLFPSVKVMSVYDALTGPRQTRMDARDLPPSTPQPAYTYRDNPVTQFLHKTLLGDNFYPYNKPVKRADGSPEEGERLTPQQIERLAEESNTAAFIAQKSGIGRKEGNISKALKSGEGQVEFLKGLTNIPQNFVGAPMDISNMIANVYGGGVEKPFMGSDYIKEGLRAKGLGFKPPEDPTLAGFYGAGDLGSNFVNPAGLTRTGVKAAEKTGEAAKMLARDFQQYNQELAVPGASYAVRNKGTPFIMTPERTTVSGQVVSEMNEADAYADKIARMVDTESGRRTDNPALANWFRSKVGAYLRRDFGTEQDQMVQAADKGLKMHFTSPRFLEDRPYALSRNIGMDREREGFPKAGFAKTAKGQEAEAIIDSSIYPLQLQDVSEKYVPQNMKQFMGTNPEMRLSEMGTSVDENLKLEKLADEMDKMFKETVFKAYGEQVPMPKDYVLTEKTLEGLTPAQASNRVALKQEWTAKKQAEFAGIAIVKDPKIVSHSYDNGSKWISPADLANNPKHEEMVKDIGCAGGWCTDKSTYALDAGSGDNRLNILLDKKFEPRVQLTVNNPTPSMRDFATYMSEMGDNSVATKLQTANYGWNTAGGRNSMGVDALVETELKAMPEYQDFIKQNQATKNITEIKGQFNTVDLTKSPYLKQVQDFVKRQGPDLQSVDNLDGINMVDMRDKMPNLSQYGKELLGRMVKLNGNSYFAGKDEFSDLIKKASQMPNNAARQIQMNMFQPPAEKAYGGMIERQPTDNRRYL